MGSVFVGGGVSMTVSGWGQFQYLRTLTLTNAECHERMTSDIANSIFASSICTFTTFGQGNCMGDSGGPLVSVSGNLVGVVSWVITCARVFHHTVLGCLIKCKMLLR